MSVRTAIKVISLAESTDRRQSFTHMAAGANVDWEFFPGCTGITEPLSYDSRASLRRCGRPLSASEIGCYTSHFKLWEWLAGSEYDQAIILEDDVLVDWKVIEQLAATNFADYDINLLRLFSGRPFRWRVIKYRLFSSHTHLLRVKGMAFGTQGYILTKAAARELVSKYAAITAPVDWVLGRYWEHRFINYCLFPFSVIERHIPSTIGDERHAAPHDAWTHRIARIGWRIRDRIVRAWVENCVIKKYPLGPTRDSGPPFIDRRAA